MKRYAIILVCILISIVSQGQSPNVILIFCDDLMDLESPFAQSLGMNTPHIDELKSEGVSFSNAVCNSPICSPSRASIFTGKHPHTTGYFGYNMGPNAWNLNPEIASSTTVFKHLRDNGYSVYGTGKIFHSSNWWINTTNFDTYEFQPNGPYAWDGLSYNATGKKIMQPHPDNHIYLDSHVDGVYPLSNVPSFPDTSGWFQDEEPFYYLNDSVRDLLSDELTVEFAETILTATHQNPFFLTLGFRKPHTPYVLPQEYFDLYPIEDISIPEVGTGEMDGIALANNHNRNYVSGNNLDFEKLVIMGQDSTDTDWWIKKHIQGYMASVSFLDDMVGEVIQLLENSLYANNTYIIFTSDHGYTLGQKETFNKNNLWSPALDIPMIIKGPGVSQNQISSNPVSLIDVYPTIVDIASLPHPTSGLDGFSMKNLAEDPINGAWDGPAYALSAVANDELIPNAIIANKNHQHYALTTETYRYIKLSSGEEELYDIQVDPNEFTNEAYTQARLADKLILKSQLENEVVLDSFPKMKGSLIYGNFEQKLNGWKHSKKTDTTYTEIVASPTSLGGSSHFKVETVPYLFDNYKFTLSNKNLELVQGNQYNLSFDARTSVYGGKVKFLLYRKNGYNSYGKVGGVGIPLDTVWQTHSLNFTYPGYSSKTDFKLTVKFMKKNRIYEIDNIKICNLTTGECDNECIVNGFYNGPTDDYTYLNAEGINFYWTPPLGSTECEVEGNLASAPLDENESQTISGTFQDAPTTLGTISYDGLFPGANPILQGEVYRWRVRCGCSSTNMSPFTEFNYFYVPILLESNDQFEKSIGVSQNFYPNPSSSGIFYTNMDNLALLQVFDSKGSLVFQGNLIHGELDLSHFPKGIYTVKAFLPESVKTSKLIIQ